MIGGTAVADQRTPTTHIDSMFKTANTSWNCTDGGLTPGNGFCQTDNSTLTWHAEFSLGTTGRSNIANRMNTEFAATDLSVSFHGTPVYTGGAETDIIFQQGTAGVSQDGVAWCNDSVGSLLCDQHYVRFRSADPSRSLACHEAGHAVGLTHGAQADPVQSQTVASFGCMKTPTGGTEVLTATLTSQINATY